MKKNFKRFISVPLCLVMAIGLLPMSALAEGSSMKGAVTANKTAALDEDGTYTITMTAKGTPYDIPSNADVVLVVDNSGSMASSVGTPCNTPRSSFAHTDSAFSGAINTYTCPKCHTSYTTYWWSGEEGLPSVCTGEVGSEPRIDTAKKVGKEFASNILKDGSDNQMAVVGFSSGGKEGGENENAITAATTLTTGETTITSAINEMKADGGTNYTAALARAKSILPEHESPGRPAYVVFISDGAPGLYGGSIGDADWDGSKQAADLKAAGVTLYAIGISLDGHSGAYLESLASDAAHYCNVDGVNYATELSSIMTEWADQIGATPAGKNAVMTDVIGDNFKFVEGSLSDRENMSYNAGTKTVTWNIGDLTAAVVTATFKVEPNNDNVYGIQRTNNNVEMTYNDGYTGNKKTVAKENIGDPEVDVPDNRSFSVTYDANGGSGTMTASTGKVGKDVTLTKNVFTRAGFTFAGWNTRADGKDGTAYADENTIENIQAPVTLFAQWTEDGNVSLTYTAGKGGAVSATSESVAPSTGTPQGSKATANAGYTFTNWTDKDNKVVSTSETFVPKKSYDLYVSNSYTANFAESGNVTINYGSADETKGSVSLKSESLAPVTGTVQGSTATASTGYHFVNWTDGKGNEVSTDAAFVPNKTGDLNVAGSYTANFAGNPDTAYNIQSYKQVCNNGVYSYSADPAVEKKTGTTGNTVTATPQTLEGYVFDESAANVKSGTIAPDGSLVLKLYYALDNKGTGDPTKPDGTPDSAQITVTYVVANGTYAEDGSTSKTAVLTLMKDGKADAAGTASYTPALTTTTIDGEYSVTGAWTPELPENYTKANDNATYTYTYTKGDAKTYSITYSEGDATSGHAPSDTTKYAANQDATILDNIGSLKKYDGNTKTNYVFAGWRKAEGNVVVSSADEAAKLIAAGSTYTVTGATTLYPAWAVDNIGGGNGTHPDPDDKPDYGETKVTLSFDINGGNSAAIAPITIVADKDYNLGNITAPMHDSVNGKKVVFAGWTTDTAATGKIYAKGDSNVPTMVSKVNVNANTTLIAVWGYDEDDSGHADISEYRTITFDVNGGSGDSTKVNVALNDTYAISGVTAPTHADTTTNHITFAGWTTDTSAKGKIYADSTTAAACLAKDATITADADKTVYAVWYTGSAIGGGSTGGGTTGGGSTGGGSTGGGSTGGGSTGGGSTGGGGTTIDDGTTPTGSTPTLNKDDHFGYITGYPDDSVHPNGEITRAEVATIFYRLLSDASRKEYFKQTNSFTDVDAAAWYNNAVSTLTNAGVITGYPNGTFNPNGTITRAEFATIATRFYDAAAKTYDSDPYTDVAASWARQYIDRAAELGIIHGYADGTFKPDSSITRAEAVKLVNNVLGRTPDKGHLLTGMKTWTDNADTSAWYYADIQEATNSHDFSKADGASYETWTKLKDAKDWTALEKEWSKG